MAGQSQRYVRKFSMPFESRKKSPVCFVRTVLSACYYSSLFARFWFHRSRNHCAASGGKSRFFVQFESGGIGNSVIRPFFTIASCNNRPSFAPKLYAHGRAISIANAFIESRSASGGRFPALFGLSPPFTFERRSSNKSGILIL